MSATDRRTHFHLVSFLIGAGAAMCLCLTYKPRITDKDVLIKRDTIERKVYVSYDKAELLKGTKTLNLPPIKNFVPLLFIPKDSVRTEYRDTGSVRTEYRDTGSVRTEYIALPRKAYRTTMPDVDIWHSGVDSQIDSVSILRTDRIIRETRRQKEWRHELTVSAHAGYNRAFRTPIGIEYSYYPTRWIGVGVKAEYDVITGSAGAYAGARLRFGW